MTGLNMAFCARCNRYAPCANDGCCLPCASRASPEGTRPEGSRSAKPIARGAAKQQAPTPPHQNISDVLIEALERLVESADSTAWSSNTNAMDAAINGARDALRQAKGGSDAS